MSPPPTPPKLPTSVRMQQLGRLYHAAQSGVDPDRTGVGRTALDELQRWGLIQVLPAGKGRRVQITVEGLKTLAAGPHQQEHA